MRQLQRSLPSHAAPAAVTDVLATQGHALDESSRRFFEPRFGADFSAVRVHTDAPAAHSAEAVDALAYAVGNHVVFGERQYAPHTGEGRQLLAHELAHVAQQGGAPRRGDAGAGSLRPSPAAAPHVARQGKPEPKPEDATTPDQPVDQPVDRFKGSPVSEIVISKARSRVGFHIPSGMLLGKVDTDLKPGKYEITPDLPNRQWKIDGPDVKAGQRFDVDLAEAHADPWTLSYPPKLPLIVAAGSTGDPKTYGESIDPATGQQKDPLFLYEGWGNAGPPPKVEGDDDYENITLDKGSVTPGTKIPEPVYVIHYRDNTEKRLVYGQLTDIMKARLSPIFQKADEEFTMFTLRTFPQWWFIVSMTPMVKMTPAGIRPYIPKRVPLAAAVPGGAGVAPGAQAGPTAAGAGAGVGAGTAPAEPVTPAAGAAKPEAAPAPAAQPEAAPAAAKTEATPAAAPAAAAGEPVFAPLIPKKTPAGVAFGTDAAARMKTQGLQGGKILKPLASELNANPALTPADKATAMYTACNKQPNFGAGSIAPMPDNSFVVTPNVYGPNRPVVIVGSNGSVGFGQADVAPVMDPSGRFTTGYNVTNVRPNP